ncbi:hypothetical protein ACFE04_031778 [Oxalis oulophora]
MLTLRIVRRFCHAAGAVSPAVSSHCVNVKDQQLIDEPALIKLKQERDPEKLFQLFKANAHNRLVIENRFAFEDTISRLAGAGRFDYIEHLLEHHKTLPQGRREGFIIRIIMLYGMAGMTKHAVDTFLKMHLYDCDRTVKSFNAALKVLTQMRDFSAINEFLMEIPKNLDIKVDVYSVNIAVKAFCDMGFSDKAYVLLLEMEKVGIKPDVITYTTLISALYKANCSEIGNGLWNLMVLKGCLPNLATFNVRIQYLVNRRRAWQANSVLELMLKSAITPDEVTYNLVIKGFCQAGYVDMAKKVYSGMQFKGYKPNAKIYQTWIHYLCKSEDFSLAYTMCNDSMRKNWFPNGDTIRVLIEGLKKKGEIEKAKMIIQLVEEKKPPYSRKHIDSLKSVLTRS